MTTPFQLPRSLKVVQAQHRWAARELAHLEDETCLGRGPGSARDGDDFARPVSARLSGDPVLGRKASVLEYLVAKTRLEGAMLTVGQTGDRSGVREAAAALRVALQGARPFITEAELGRGRALLGGFGADAYVGPA